MFSGQEHKQEADELEENVLAQLLQEQIFDDNLRSTSLPDIRRLLMAGADADIPQQTNDGNYTLYNAPVYPIEIAMKDALRGNTDLLRILLEHGVNPNPHRLFVDEDGKVIINPLVEKNPIFRARIKTAGGGYAWNYEIVQFILAHAKKSHDLTLLGLVLIDILHWRDHRPNDVETRNVVLALINAGAELNVIPDISTSSYTTYKKDGRFHSPLYEAVYMKDFILIAKLLSRGADPTTGHESGYSPAGLAEYLGEEYLAAWEKGVKLSGYNGPARQTPAHVYADNAKPTTGFSLFAYLRKRSPSPAPIELSDRKMSEEKMENDDKLVSRFYRSYRGLLAGEDGCKESKTNFLDKIADMSTEAKKDAIQEQIHAYPAGRTAIAWRLASETPDDDPALTVVKVGNAAKRMFHNDGYLRDNQLTLTNTSPRTRRKLIDDHIKSHPNCRTEAIQNAIIKQPPSCSRRGRTS